MFRASRPFLLAFSVAAFSVSLIAPNMALAADVDATASAQPQEQAKKSPDGKFIQDLGDRAIKIIANKDLSTEQRRVEFGKLLNDSFDIRTIGRFVIGRTWNAATPDQQNEYMDLFKALVIRNYGDRMTLATGEGFKIVGARPESDLDTIVSSQITHPDGSEPTVIDWRVRQKDGKIGVIDVMVEGVSLSVTQRQEYASVLQSSGGQIDGLLQAMRDQLKTGTASASAAN